MDRQLIEAFAGGGERLRAACAGLSREDVLATPGPGDWSIQQLVIHLADSDAIVIERMKRILTEDNPTLLWADESAYARRLHCEAQSIEDALLLFEVGRRQFARILRKLSEADFQRVGTHNKRGEVSLEGLLSGYNNHLETHLKFLLAKRERLGKPVAEEYWVRDSLGGSSRPSGAQE